MRSGRRGGGGGEGGCFFFQAEDGIRDIGVTGVQTCALPIFDKPEFIFLCSGVNVAHYATDKSLLAFLRDVSRAGVKVGGLCTASYIDRKSVV